MSDKSYREQRRQQLEILLSHATDLTPALKTSFENSGMYIGSGAYAVMLFKPEGAFTWDEPDFAEKWDSVYSHLRDTVANTLQPRFLNHTEVMGSHVLSLVCIPDISDKDAMAAVPHELHELAARIEELSDIQVSAAISSLFYGVSGIKKAWEDARSVMDFADFLTSPPAILAQEKQESEGWHSEEDVTYRRWIGYILDSIRDGDEAGLRRVTEELLTFLTITPPFGAYYLNLRVELFFAHFTSALLESGMAHMDFVEALNPVIGLTLARDEGAFRNLMADYFRQVQDNYRAVTNGGTMTDILRVKEHIDSNITDVNLNVASMAEKFGLSESSLTYQFKKYWSYTPTEYISRRRTAMAQRIIAAGHRSIDDVAVDVGFGSYLTMHRAFKKYYGAPPGAFRRKNGGDQQ